MASSVNALLLVVLVVGQGACASTSTGAVTAVAPASLVAGDYYPLNMGWKWSYEVERDGEKILAFYSVLERTPQGAVVQAGEERLFYLITPDGIARKEGAVVTDFLIKSPVAVGTTWPVAGGTAAVRSVGQEVTLDSGKYPNCAMVEEARTDPTRLIRTTFAPGVGPVLVEVQVQEGAKFVTATRATLRGVTRPGQDPLGM
ncbi:MAG TPA: hypothetical protein VFH73_08410 [Polyangia bacterium]|nr:hypothetical protein [Polyangia bacterium]